MLAPNAARAATGGGRRSPRDVGQLGGKTNSTLNTKPDISATLCGSNECEAANIVTTGHTPVLAMCRQLLQQGVDPDTALTVYRRGIVALRVRSIGRAARLAVEVDRYGRPQFRKARERGAGAASPMRKNGEATL